MSIDVDKLEAKSKHAMHSHQDAESRALAFLNNLIEDIENISNELASSGASVAAIKAEVDALVAGMKTKTETIAHFLAHGK